MAGRDVAESRNLPAPEPSSPSSKARTPAPSSRGRNQGPILAGRYRSLFVIGKGGMGTVEAALEIEPASEGSFETTAKRKRPRNYERIVALKRLLPDSVHDKRRVEMFLREARLAALLDHPNVVTAYDYGELEGELFLAMEYVEGQPLSRILKSLAEAGEDLPTSVAAWILAEVCRGLHAAHELADPTTALPLQLVHRDVSPQNVMVGYDGQIRLLDFGVAKIESESVTKTGEVKGKTAYMSPEQAMGDALDRRSDLFSVGSVLFECVTLRRMWGDGTDMEVIRKLALESPPSLESGGVALPKGLSELHARLVAREARNRPATAIEVAGDLMAFVDDPQAAAEKLRAILDTHFADQAREQRDQLTEALQVVAPGQADELRESILPSTHMRAASVRMRSASKPSGHLRVAREPEAKAVEATPPEPEKKGKSTVALGVLAAAIVGLIAWRQVGGSSTTTTPAAIPSATMTTTATTPTTTASAPAASSAASAAPVASATTPTSSNRVPSSVPVIATPTRSTASTNPNTARTVATPQVVPSARPTASVRPPDLDEKPF